MEILHLPGDVALSAFRLEKYLSALQTIFPSVCKLQAFYEYFIESAEPLSVEQLEQLDELLNQQKVPARKFDRAARLCLVVPRVGTISPWSTKATDIAHLCDFTSIKRLERGISFYLELAHEPLSAADLDKASELLHDRMLETVFYSFDQISQLFTVEEVSSFTEIEVLQHGERHCSKRMTRLDLH